MVTAFAAGARAARRLAIALLMVPAIAACSTGVADLFGDAPPPPPPPVFVPKSQAERDATDRSSAGGAAPLARAANGEESFPNLSQVPVRPDPGLEPSERQQVSDQLVADRQRAQYTREQLSGVMSDGGGPSPPPAAAVRSRPATSAEQARGGGDQTAATKTRASQTPDADSLAQRTQDLSDAVSQEVQPLPATAARSVSTTAPRAGERRAADDGEPGIVPPPPSVGGDEAENIRRVAESRSALTAGTDRGSQMLSRGERPVLERTERLTAALNDPGAGSVEVEEFTRRIAEGSPSARAVPPGGGRTAAVGADAPPLDRSTAMAARGSAGQDEVISSRRADELLAARAAEELDAYAVEQMTDGRNQAQPSGDRLPEPRLTTSTTAVQSDRTADLEAAAQRAIEVRARGGDRMIAREAEVVERVTPQGEVTTMVAEREVFATPPRQPEPPPVPVRQPQTLAEVYEAQLRAASASSLHQAAQEGAVFAALPMAPSPLQPIVQQAQAYPVAQAAPMHQRALAQPFQASQGTVVVSGSGVSMAGAPMSSGMSGSYAATGAAGTDGLKAGTIRFNAGSNRLGSGDLASLRRIANRYPEFGGMVRVVGHASSRTSDMPPDQHRTVNFEISQARAEAVARQLQHYGIPTQALIVEARSDLDPIYYEAMPAAETANRRAEIYFVQ